MSDPRSNEPHKPDVTAELLSDADAKLGALPVEVPGSRIGPYRLVQQIGEGGFGAVFLAEQEQPVRRSVAIKVVKLGMDTRQVVARFEQERQTLALMEHPNIARVLDAGATETGRPYFVMELVRGDPIVDYCDKNSLDIEARVGLVVDVCLAVQHAHTKGIIHRDIKPSNILIAMQDGAPCAKVIDFGIAKATSVGFHERSVFTEQRQLIGTPQYMSPEQADGSLDIDTRSDIYSLGVLLYELLTGTTPFSQAELRSASINELQRIIREVDPPRPSTRVARSTDTISGIASRRRSEPATLGAAMRGELDWIVMKAMEKDRTRRYGSASELAEDIGRYLRGDAVLAAPPSRAYQVRKFARRHRFAVGAGAAVAAALLLGATAFAWQAHVARSQRDRAVEAENQQRQRAIELKAVAEFQAKMLSQIDVAASGERLVKGLREQFAEAIAKSGAPEAERSNRVATFAGDLSQVNATDAAAELVRSTVLRPALQAIDAEFRTQPIVDATLRQTLAQVHVALGSAEEALPLQQRAYEIRKRELGQSHRDTLDSLDRIGMITETLGRTAEAEGFYRQAYELRLAALGEDDHDTLVSMSNLGNIYRDQNKLVEAEPLLIRALEGHRRVGGNEHRDTLTAMNTMGYFYVSRGELAKAEPLWREAYETGTRVLGADNPDVIVWTYNLAGLMQDMGQAAAAEPLFRSVLEKYRRIYGDAHPSTITVLGGLCTNLFLQSRLVDAEPFAREALDRSREGLGPEHPVTLRAMATLGSLLIQLERADEAETLLREALAVHQRTFGEEHPQTLNARELLARSLLAAGKSDEATKLYTETLEIAKRVLGPEHPQTLTIMVNAGNAYLTLFEAKLAEPLVTEALAGRRRVSGENHRETLLALSNVGLLRELQGQLEEAETIQRDSTQRFKQTLGPEHISTINANINLAIVLRKRGKPAESEALMRDALPLLIRRLGPESRRVASVAVVLGQSLVDLERWAEADATLRPAVERLIASPATPAFRRIEFCEAMATLCERREKAEPGKGYGAEAAVWRAKAQAITP
jgi:serine/threonine protein kinase/tetratricopeptide (TPR) repeat protein